MRQAGKLGEISVFPVSEAGTGSDVMLHVTVPQLDDDVCRRLFPMELTPNMICAGHLKGGKDSCQVRSGSGVQGVRGAAGQGYSR